ncbi:MAG: hypothetical protein AAFQ68_01405 [Bacteroidota bacterium]
MVEIDPYQLLRLSLERPLAKNEQKALREAREQDPYFALLHFLQAKQSQSEQNRFIASVYASNRKLYRRYMEGKTYLSPSNTSMPAETTHPTVSPSPNLSFAVLDFDGLCQNCSLTDGVFQMVGSEHSKTDHWLEDRLRERRARYLGLGDKIKAQLQESESKSEEHTSLASRERDQALIDQFLASPPKSKSKRKLIDHADTKTPDPGASSIEAGEELVTETFARLLVLQGKPEDAIDIYKKLSLRFPQKSAYFDAQIEKIRIK